METKASTETLKAVALGMGGAYSMETKTSTGSSRGAASGMVGEDYMGRKTSTDWHGNQNLHRPFGKGDPRFFG
jgi:hypothetical protein